MATKSSRRSQKASGREESSGSPRAFNPVEAPPAIRDWTEASDKTAPAESQVAALASESPPAMELPHLLTPLAALWPATNLPLHPTEPKSAPLTSTTSASTATRTVKVTFVLLDLGSKQVSLSGDFNGWDANGIPMERDAAGNWQATVALAPGRYEYKFLVDRRWIPDPLAREQVWNLHGTLNSVIDVRG